MKTAFLSFLLITLCGCVTHSSKISGVSIGMSKAEALKIMGKPASVTADREAEYLNYSLLERFGVVQPYTIRVVSGKVDSYGRAGSPQSGMIAAPVVVPVVR